MFNLNKSNAAVIQILCSEEFGNTTLLQRRYCNVVRML